MCRNEVKRDFGLNGEGYWLSELALQMIGFDASWTELSELF